MLFYFIFLLCCQATDVLFVQSLYTDFKFANSASVCNSDNYTNCFEILCEFLNQTIAYVAFVPFSAQLDCPATIPDYKNATMIVFGLDVGPKTKIVTVAKCNTVGQCFTKGCEMYNNNHDVDWILFTGEC